MRDIKIFTDGGSRGNPGLGAWAFVAFENGEEMFSDGGSELSTTNNRMELMALLNAAQWAVQNAPDAQVDFFSDSSFAVSSITEWYPQYIVGKQWHDKKHLDLIGMLFALFTMHKDKWTLTWIKGHADSEENCRVDQLVNKTMDMHQSEVKASDEQERALKEIKSFIASDSQVFILTGYAGTGKTTLIKKIVDHLQSSKMLYALMAPTGRAANVLKTKVGVEATTIHRGIYDFVNMLTKVDDEDIAKSSLTLYCPIIEQNNRMITIVDESSMISNVESLSEMWKFGTNHLLDDLLTFAFHAKGSKLILVGDSCQLPPVNERISSALNADFYRQKGMGVQQFELLQVMRQDSGSPILKSAETIRDSIKNNRFNDLKLASGNQIAECAPTDVVRLYNTSDDMSIITYSNSKSSEYNRLIRQRLYGSSSAHIAKGERLMVTHNHYDKNTATEPIDIMNGEFLTVISVDGEIETHTAPVYVNEAGNSVKQNITISFLDVTVATPFGKTWKGKIIINPLLYNDSPDLTLYETKALYIVFCMNHRHLKDTSPDFRDALLNDSYFNALHVKFGYAITCHKSQGGEWDKVIVDFEGVRFNAFGARWIYTALTRARQQLVCVNFPTTTPAANLHILPIKQVSRMLRLSSQQSVALSEYNPSTNATSTLLDIMTEAANSATVTILSISEQPLAYKVIYVLATSAPIAWLDIYINSKGFITSIQPNSSLIHDDKMEKLIECLSKSCN